MTYRFDLPAARLSDGVARIGAVADVSIVAPDPALLAAFGREVHVRGTAADVIAALLASTPAKAERTGPNAWRIVARRRQISSHTPMSSPTSALEADIIVTGSKQDMPLSSYPGSVTLITGATLTQFGRTPDSNSLGRLDPTLQSTHLGPGRNKLFLGGIADSSFNGSSAALVGQYVDDLRLTYNAPDPALRLYDLREVEIIEGPQGTLYGAGSMAGLVRAVPNAPAFDRTSGEAWAGGTVTAHGEPGGDLGGVINLPFADNRAALRLVGYAARDGGYIDDPVRRRNDVNRTGTSGGRATLRVRLGAEWHVDMGGIAQDIHNRDAQYADRGLPPLTRSTAVAQPSYNLLRASDLVLAGPVAGLDFTSTSGFIHQSLGQEFLPDDGNDADIYRQRDRIRLLSEEARLTSGTATGRRWVIGASALSSERDQIRSNTLGGFERSLGEAHTNAVDITMFGTVSIDVTRALSLSAGGRFSAVRLSGRAQGARVKSVVPAGPQFDGVRHEHFTLPSLAIAWKPDPSWLLFLRFGEGYRPGGLTASGVIERFDSDRIDSIETGVRLKPHGISQLAAQLSATLSRWQDIQADTLAANGLPITTNIGNGYVRSVSGALTWTPNAQLEAKLAATLARGRVTGIDPVLAEIARTPLPNVARDTFAIALRYALPIADGHRITADLSANHIGRSVLGSGSELTNVRQGGYWLMSSGAELTADYFTLTLTVDNLLDSHANSFAFGIPTVRYDGTETTPLRPRSVRIGIDRRF